LTADLFPGSVFWAGFLGWFSGLVFWAGFLGWFSGLVFWAGFLGGSRAGENDR
jgi:hypothetical protein